MSSLEPPGCQGRHATPQDGALFPTRQVHARPSPPIRPSLSTREPTSLPTPPPSRRPLGCLLFILSPLVTFHDTRILRRRDTRSHPGPWMTAGLPPDPSATYLLVGSRYIRVHPTISLSIRNLPRPWLRPAQKRAASRLAWLVCPSRLPRDAEPETPRPEHHALAACSGSSQHATVRECRQVLFTPSPAAHALAPVLFSFDYGVLSWHQGSPAIVRRQPVRWHSVSRPSLRLASAGIHGSTAGW